MLRFVGAAGSVIAIDLGGTRCDGALADLAGTTIAEDFRPTLEGRRTAGALRDCIAALRPGEGSRNWPVRAVVVGIPALIDPRTGLATAGPNVHWQDFDLMRILAAQVAEPFEVENDANLGALGQAWRVAGRGVHSFVTMSLGTGIGGGIVVDGHLITGRHNAAGEVGHLHVGGPRAGYGYEDVASGALSLAGPGWTCDTGTASCHTNGGVTLAAGQQTELTLTVAVPGDAPSDLQTFFQVSDGGAYVDPTYVRPER